MRGGGFWRDGVAAAVRLCQQLGAVLVLRKTRVHECQQGGDWREQCAQRSRNASLLQELAFIRPK